MTENDESLNAAILRLNGRAWGIAAGLLLGGGLFIATNILVLKGGPVVGPNLVLLSQYFPGYRVTAFGSLVGLAYGLLAGFVGGFTFAAVRNATLFFYEAVLRRRAERGTLGRFIDYI